MTQTVEVVDAKERSEVSLSLNPDSIQTGGTTAATATVFTAGEDPASGHVEFWAGTRLAGSGQIDATGKATATLSGFTAAGTIPVTAKYLGDATARWPAPRRRSTWWSPPPGQPTPKVKPVITLVAPETVKVGKKPKVKIIVSAPKVTPSGKVTVTTKLGGESKTYEVMLDANGQAKLKLKKVREVGTLKVNVAYAGDAAVEPGTAKTTIEVVKKKK